MYIKELVGGKCIIVLMHVVRFVGFGFAVVGGLRIQDPRMQYLRIRDLRIRGSEDLRI